MNGISKVIIAGNLVHDPAVKYTDGGAAWCTISVAVNLPKKTASGAWSSEVHYFDAVVWGRQAEALAQHRKKGDPVLVDGTLTQSRWETNDGQKRSKVVIAARSVNFLPRGKSDAGASGDGIPHNVGQAFPDAEPVADEEIPF